MRLDLSAGAGWLAQLFSPADRPADGSVDAGTFRDLMRDVPEPVAIIAAGPSGRRNGLTATAVCPVSDGPPTMLVCVRRHTSAHDVIRDSGYFSINFLANHQAAVAMRFSGADGIHGDDRFLTGHWTAGAHGAPVLGGAVCSLECRLTENRPVATHTVFLGEIVAATRTTQASPLLYMQGTYHTLPVAGGAGQPQAAPALAGQAAGCEPAAFAKVQGYGRY